MLRGQGKINAGVGGAFMLSELSISVINEKLQRESFDIIQAAQTYTGRPWKSITEGALSH